MGEVADCLRKTEGERRGRRVLHEWLDLAPVAARDERYYISFSPIT